MSINEITRTARIQEGSDRKFKIVVVQSDWNGETSGKYWSGNFLPRSC
jgi:hypothetical protein